MVGRVRWFGLGGRSAIAGCWLRLAVLVAALSPGVAKAGGFATARFGGEHSTAADLLPSAIYYNPGAIGLLDGQHLMIDAAIALHTAEYKRDEGIDQSTFDLAESAGVSRDDVDAALAGEATLSNWAVLPFLGAVTDFGMPHFPLRLGAAFFVPFGGQSDWDTKPDNPMFPGASDGPSRWYVMEGTIRSLTAALDLAYRFEAARLALGISGNLYFNEVNTVRARNANATDNLIAADGTLIEGRSLLDVTSTAFGLGAGVLWEALPKKLWLGASYQSQPGFGTLELDGTLANTLGAANPAEPVDVVFTEELPDIVRAAGRFKPTSASELRLELRWERWSQLEHMCLANASVDDVEAACATRSDGSLVNDQYLSDVVQIFARDWRDTLAVRGGVSFFPYTELELLLGAGYETSAVPDRTLDPALYDMDKLSFALGAGYTLGAATLSLTLTEILYFERDTRDTEGNESLELPSRQPSNVGVFGQNAFLIQPAAVFTF
jgi:long-chain fatty acid transport protein